MAKVLFIGDIVGHPGRTFVYERLPSLRKELEADLVVANGENTAGGAGITASIAAELLKCGVDAITLGDHVWDQRGFAEELPRLERICRPANLPSQCPGVPYLIVEAENGFRLGVFTVLGRQFMKITADCAFTAIDACMNALSGECDGILAEIHAETTSEKTAVGWYLDGRASLVVGTHTHIPTADAQILPRGTGYITDAGMSGPYASCLGREVQPVIARFLDGMPRKFEVATDDVRLCGVLVDIDKESGAATAIERIEVRQDA